jgi:hypothetical protein
VHGLTADVGGVLACQEDVARCDLTGLSRALHLRLRPPGVNHLLHTAAGTSKRTQSHLSTQTVAVAGCWESPSRAAVRLFAAHHQGSCSCTQKQRCFIKKRGSGSMKRHSVAANPYSSTPANLGECGRDEWCPNGSWGHGVDPDVLAHQLVGQGAGERKLCNSTSAAKDLLCG